MPPLQGLEFHAPHPQGVALGYSYFAPWGSFHFGGD